MILAFYILCTAGVIGACDVLYFHIYTCRLFQRPECAAENTTHAIRALLFSAFFTLILYVDARGAWWYLYPGLCALEMVNSMLDTYLEKQSRASQGGLANGEYCLHVFLSVLMGAMMLSLLVHSYPAVDDATSFSLRSLDVPPLFKLAGSASILAGLLFCAFDSLSIIRVRRGHWATRVVA